MTAGEIQSRLNELRTKIFKTKEELIYCISTLNKNLDEAAQHNAVVLMAEENLRTMHSDTTKVIVMGAYQDARDLLEIHREHVQKLEKNIFDLERTRGTLISQVEELEAQIKTLEERLQSDGKLLNFRG